LATKYTYDPVKAAQASSLIKSGVDEEEALRRAGIPEEAWGAYVFDDVPGSPSRGTLIRQGDGTVTVYSADEEKAIADAEAKRVAEQEAAREKRNQEIAAERQANLERLRKEREAEKAAAAKGWSDEEDKSETTGPTNTRGEVTTTVSGGGERETRMTAEMRAWSDKNAAAYKADEAATTAAKQEYLRSLGLDQSNFREKNKALRAAEAEGKNFNVTTNRDALGPPPKNQYEEVTIRPNATGVQKPNDGTQTDDQANKNSAAGQTAEEKIKNESISPEPGVGSKSPDKTTDPMPAMVPAAAVSAAEADKINNNQNRSDAAEELPPNAFPAPPPSEAKSSEKIDSKQGKQQGSITGTTSSDKVDTTKTENDKQKELSFKLAAAKKNKLHDYASSTYRITLYLLSAQDYAALVDRPDKFNPKYVLISSGGSFPNAPLYNWNTGVTTSGRHPDFQEDFFIENLSLTTVVGLNAKTKASNAVEINFTIVEPYGMTLLDRLMSACESAPVYSPNYIDQPYLLEIDFLSNVDEARNKSIRIDRKRVAIKIAEMKIKPGAGGTEYRCRAIPFNHVAFQDSVAALPIALSVQAGTVGEFFDSESEIAKIFSPEVAADEERIESELGKWATEVESTGGTKPTAAEIAEQRNRLRSSTSYTTKSYPAGYNTFMRGISGAGKTFQYPPSLIAFNIADTKIKKSKIVDEINAEVRTTPMADPMESIKASVLSSPAFKGKSKQGFNINPGINIVQLIDRVMQSSEYISGQLKEAKEAIAKNSEIIANRSNLLNDPNQTQYEKDSRTREIEEARRELNKYKFLDWYKIIPQVYLLDFDPSRNAYSKQVVYTIVPYKAANAYHPDFAKTRINKSKIVRSYNYLYTGLNQDIVSIEIDFDSLYYTSITAYQDSKTATSVGYSEPTINQDNDARDVEPGKSNKPNITNPPVEIKPRGVNAKGAGQVNRADKKDSSAVSDIADSIYTSSRGDMLNVQLRIIGDPGFIKQDDIYYNPMSVDYEANSTLGVSGSNGNETVPVNPDTGQIIFDQEQVFVQLLIKSASDIDDETGITNKQIKLLNGRQTDATFSGVYKVLKVKSDFNRGKFEQTLELIKMPNDLFYDDSPKVNTKVELKAGVTQTEPVVATPAPAPASNPTIDTTGIAVADNTKLKEAAAEPATNPVPRSSGEGTVATASQPTEAAPSNASDATAIAPQEQSLADVKDLLSEYDFQEKQLSDSTNLTISQFNGKLRELRQDTTLSAEVRAEKVIALRKELQQSLDAALKENAAIFQSTFALSQQQSIKGTDQFIVWSKLTNRLNNNAKTLREYYTGQEVKIQDIIQTGSVV